MVNLILDMIFILKFQMTLGEIRLLCLLKRAWAIEKALRHFTRSSKLYNKHLCIKTPLETALLYSLHPPLKKTHVYKEENFSS